MSYWHDGEFGCACGNGTTYHDETPEDVIRILDAAMRNRSRLRVFYGDTRTGRDWCEERNIMGYIGRSTGTQKIPLMINNSRSMGGSALLDHCIVRITSGGRDLYAHPDYHIGRLTIQDADAELQEKGYTHSVFRDGQMQANFRSWDNARNYIEFLQGIRNRL